MLRRSGETARRLTARAAGRDVGVHGTSIDIQPPISEGYCRSIPRYHLRCDAVESELRAIPPAAARPGPADQPVCLRWRGQIRPVLSHQARGSTAPHHRHHEVTLSMRSYRISPAAARRCQQQEKRRLDARARERGRGRPWPSAPRASRDPLRRPVSHTDLQSGEQLRPVHGRQRGYAAAIYAAAGPHTQRERCLER